MTLKAKDFSNRAELEKHIRVEFGDDIKENKKSGHSILGTRMELAKLQLSDTTTMWGIKCTISDTPTKDFKGVKVGQIKK